MKLAVGLGDPHELWGPSGALAPLLPTDRPPRPPGQVALPKAVQPMAILSWNTTWSLQCPPHSNTEIPENHIPGSSSKGLPILKRLRSCSSFRQAQLQPRPPQTSPAPWRASRIS